MSEAHPPTRREAILGAALDLFRRQGFHAVGIDEIGTAAGISGPGVYRHFPSKGAVLVALFDDISERMLDGARKVASQGAHPAETLEALVDLHVAFAARERALLAVWLQEWRSLPGTDRARFRDRQMGYMAEWIRALADLRADLTAAEASTIAYAACNTINSVAAHDSGLERDVLDPLLRRLALAVLCA